MAFKQTMITAGISVLGTIAVGGVKALQDLQIVAPSAPSYSVQVAQPLSTIDWLWWQVVWWLLPVAGVAVVGAVVFVAVNGNRPAKVKKEKYADDMIPSAKLTRLMPLETPAAEPVVRGFGEGLRKLTRTEIPLGYTKTGQIVTWDVTQAPHIRVHGKTQGSGKTNLIKQIAACALRAGHHVIVLDRRGFKDWRADYEKYVEYIDNRKAGAFANVTSQVKTLYQRRDGVLGQYGAGNIEELPKKYQRLFVVIAEFGTACREAPEDELTKVVSDLKTIMSEAGATGVHMVYEAQVVNHDWPRELRGNGDPICGYLPEDTSKAGGYSYAYQLKPYEFHYDGEIFKTWDMKKYAWQVLQSVQPTTKRLIVTRSLSVPDEGFGNDEERLGNGLGTPSPVGNAGNVPVPNPQNPLKNIYDRSRSWEDVAKVYFQLYPQSEHADWVRAMAEIANDGRPHTDFKGRLSSGLYHQYSPKGNNAQPEKPSPNLRPNNVQG